MVAAARAAGADELSALRVPVLLFGVAALLKAMLYAMLSPEVEANASREEQGHGGEGGEGGKGGKGCKGGTFHASTKSPLPDEYASTMKNAV